MSDLDALTDEELMKAYQLGNESAFGVLYRRYSGRLYGFLRGKLRDRVTTDEVFQGAWLKLHQTRGGYDASFPFAPWLFAVSRSVLVDHARKRARSLEDLDAAAVEAAIQVEPETTALPDLGALPATQRSAIELRYSAGLSFDEIARRLETSPSNVRQLVSRAIKKLRGSK